MGISIELNAKTSRDDVKIATDYNCFAKDRKYNRKSINLRLKLTIRRLSRFLHQAFVLLTNICVQLKLFYPAGRGRSPSEGLLPFILFASSPPHSPSMIVVRRAATPLFASICSKFRKSTSFQTIFQRHNSVGLFEVRLNHLSWITWITYAESHESLRLNHLNHLNHLWAESPESPESLLNLNHFQLVKFCWITWITKFPAGRGFAESPESLLTWITSSW